MPKGYPPEFRRKVLDLLAAGRSVTEVAEDLGISGACIYNWRKQDRTDRGELPGLTSIERAELVAARRRINTLEAELAAERRAKELLREAVPPKGRFAIIAVMAAEGHSIKVSCGVLQVTEAGFYAWRNRPPSERAMSDRGPGAYVLLTPSRHWIVAADDGNIISHFEPDSEPCCSGPTSRILTKMPDSVSISALAAQAGPFVLATAPFASVRARSCTVSIGCFSRPSPG